MLPAPVQVLGNFDDQPSQDARADGSDEALHFAEIGMEGVGHDKVDLIWIVAVEHQEICVDADEIVASALLFLLDDIFSVAAGDQLNPVPAPLLCCKDVHSDRPDAFELVELVLSDNQQRLKVLRELDADVLLPESSHCNQHVLSAISLDYLHHLPEYLLLAWKFEVLVAVGIIKDQFVDVNRAPDLRVGSELRGKEHGVGGDHALAEPKIPRPHDRTHIPLEQKHHGPRYVVSVEEPDVDRQGIVCRGELNGVFLVQFERRDVLHLGKLLQNELSGDLAAEYGPVVPFGRQPFIVILVEVGHEMNERVFRVLLAIVEIVNYYVCVGNHSHGPAAKMCASGLCLLKNEFFFFF